MITYLKINGFKSFHNFEMHFTPLTVIAGVNASGKSNLFDVLQLLARLAETDFKTAFHELRGNPRELFTQYEEDKYASEMDFAVEMLVNRKIQDNWGGKAELKYTRLRYELRIKRVVNQIGFENFVLIHESLENIKRQDDQWVKNHIHRSILGDWLPPGGRGPRSSPYIVTEDRNSIPTVIVSQDGTASDKKTFVSQNASQTFLSSFNTIEFKQILAAKQEMLNWKLIQLNPEDLRQPTPQDVGIKDTITSRGKNLAAALFRIQQDDKSSLKKISQNLKTFLPNFSEVNVYDDKENGQFIIKIKDKNGREFSSRVLSEGTLRLLALCILKQDKQHTGLLCFEEPENSIYPSHLEDVVILLKDLVVDFENPEKPLRQVIVNTHSPILVSKFVKEKDYKDISIWLSSLTTLTEDIEGQKMNIKITKMQNVFKRKDEKIESTYNNYKDKRVVNQMIKYLENADMEDAFDSIHC